MLKRDILVAGGSGIVQVIAQHGFGAFDGLAGHFLQRLVQRDHLIDHPHLVMHKNRLDHEFAVFRLHQADNIVVQRRRQPARHAVDQVLRIQDRSCIAACFVDQSELIQPAAHLFKQRCILDRERGLDAQQPHLIGQPLRKPAGRLGIDQHQRPDRNMRLEQRHDEQRLRLSQVHQLWRQRWAISDLVDIVGSPLVNHACGEHGHVVQVDSLSNELLRARAIGDFAH